MALNVASMLAPTEFFSWLLCRPENGDQDIPKRAVNNLSVLRDFRPRVWPTLALPQTLKGECIGERAD